MLVANRGALDVTVWWVDFSGKERHNGIVGAFSEITIRTHPGHNFVVRSLIDHTLLEFHEMSDQDDVVQIEPCGGAAADAGTLDMSRWAEFAELASEARSPCVGPSSNWSCVRWVSDAEIAARDQAKYGFSEDDVKRTSPPRKVGADTDDGYVEQQPKIINVTEFGGGYLKMRMTKRMKELLYPWFYERRKDSEEDHGTISGAYANDATIPMHKVNLDSFQTVRLGLVREMGQVLQWWTKQPLRHTSTFGIRIYHRGSMLLNHLDRADTHIASAVLQVDQSVDEGWPLEVVHPWHPGRKEVYLQPGEMVLYEGARLMHGRPMRLVGDDFANVFSHFAPLSWEGPNDAPENPFFRKKPDSEAKLETLEL